MPHDQVVAGAQQHAQQVIGGGHAGSVDATVLATLQGGDRAGQRIDGGVRHAAVLVASAQIVRCILGERGGGVDRHVDGAHELVGLVACVDGICVVGHGNSSSN